MMNNFVQIITAVIGGIGFAIFFNVEKSKLPAIGVGCFMSWALYLICIDINNSIFTSSLIAALAVCIYSEIMARVMKTPANVFLIPCIIPLLPGGSLYYTMAASINMDMATVKMKGLETLLTALGIAAGVVLGFFIFMHIINYSNKVNRKNA